MITKSGTNAFHGSAFIFHNREALNARSNLDKSAGLGDAPERQENQGIRRDRRRAREDRPHLLLRFVSAMDGRATGVRIHAERRAHRIGTSDSAIRRRNRPQLSALLKHLPAGNANGREATFTADGRSYTVPLGSLTGSSPLASKNIQISGRVDHHLTPNHTLAGRYLLSDTPTNMAGDIQVTPSGLTTNSPSNRQALSIWTNSVVGSATANELRAGWVHFGTRVDPVDPVSLEIPSIEITELGMTGALAARSRTAIGLASNLPTYRYDDLYQLQNTFTHARRDHLINKYLNERIGYT